MKYILVVLLLIGCGGTETTSAERKDRDRPCYDECDENADCADGLLCSRVVGNICVPSQCIVCWASKEFDCWVDEVWEEGETFPVCTFSNCR
jgi:hypothetical protein